MKNRIKYRILDRQFDCARAFCDGELFNSVSECVEQIADYHMIDASEEMEDELESIIELNNVNSLQAWHDLADIFEWELEEVRVCDCGQEVDENGIAVKTGTDCKKCCDGHKCTYGCDTCFCGCHE